MSARIVGMAWLSIASLALGCPEGTQAEGGTEPGSTSSPDPTSAETTSGPGTTGGGCPQGWYNPDWDARAWVTVDTDSLTAPLQSLVVPIQLPELAEMARPDGFDFRFIDESGSSLRFELEAWEAASGGVAWVRLEDVQPGTDLGFWVYFDHPLASAGDNPQEVWAEHGSVWHLGRTVDGVLPEATQMGPAATTMGTFDTAGALGLARRFVDTADGHIDFGEQSDVLFNGWSQMSMSMWISVDHASDEEWVMAQWLSRGGAIDTGVTVREADQPAGMGSLLLDAAFQGDEVVTTSFEIPREQWVWLAWDFDGDALRTYLDGQLVEELDVTGAVLATGQYPLVLGAQKGAFIGRIDELRILDRSHSANEYEMLHRAMTFQLTSLGAVERCE